MPGPHDDSGSGLWVICDDIESLDWCRCHINKWAVRGQYNCCNWPHGHAADAHELGGHKCWVMLEIQKYSNIYGQHESNTQATGHSMVAKTGLRIPRTDAWIAPQSDSSIGIRLKYIPMSLVRSVQSPVRRYMLRSAYVSGVRRVASHVRNERAGQKLCTTAIMRLQDTKLVCLCVSVCLWGLFGTGDCPSP